MSIFPVSDVFYRRMVAVIANTATQLLPYAGNLLISFIVINQYSADWWGKLNALQVFWVLAVAGMAWGNKEFLLREFSKTPSGIGSLWKGMLLARLPLLLLSVLLSFFMLSVSTQETIHLVIWLVAGYFSQSADVLVLYHKKFINGILAESLSIITGLLGLFLLRDKMSYQVLISILSVMQVVKAIVLLFFFYRMGSGKQQQENFSGWSSFRQASVFALLGFTGLFFSRSNLVCADIYLDDTSLAGFRVLIGILIMIQAGSAFLFQPFAGGFYRLDHQRARQLSRSFVLPGFVLSILVSLLLEPFMRIFFKMPLDLPSVVSSALFMFAAYISLPSAYELFRRNKVRTVVIINLVATLLQYGLYLVLMNTWKPSTSLALVAAAAAQCVIATMFILVVGRLKITINNQNP